MKEPEQVRDPQLAPAADHAQRASNARARADRWCGPLGRAALLLGAACWVFAPLAMPPGYVPWRHTISELAAQGLAHASLARAGLALWGLAGWCAAAVRPGSASPVVRLGLAGFGLSMAAAAVWSHRPWLPGVGYRVQEDQWHSVAASLAGTCIVLALSTYHLARCWRHRQPDTVAWLAWGSAWLCPLLMQLHPAAAGAWQRAMFAAVGLWLWRLLGGRTAQLEAKRAHRATTPQ